MKWRAPADRRVVEAIVASFGEPADRSRERLSVFKLHDWERTYHWLDASGMALYLSDHLHTLDIEDALPAAVTDRFRQNLADNQVRSAVMFAEFTAINRAFQQAGIHYSNLKGFTLSPDACPDPRLRCQLDLDFLVDGRHLTLCQEILARTGYKLTAATATVWEFKAGSSELASIADHYKPKPQRSVELHFSATDTRMPWRDERLDRLRLHSWGGIVFPALSLGDQFVGQALHLLGHLRSACTRLAWLLEYKRHVSARYDDVDFWNEVEESSQAQGDAPIAIGLTTLLSLLIFGGSAPSLLENWTLERLPPAVKLWAKHYGRQALLADFPGTKLYLLLEGELRGGDNSWQKERRVSLLPLRRVPPILHAGASDNPLQSIRRKFYQTCFILFRLRFHVIEGLRYMIEAARWKRCTAALRESPVYQRSKISPSNKSQKS